MKISYSTVFEQTADQVWVVIRDFNSYPVTRLSDRVRSWVLCVVLSPSSRHIFKRSSAQFFSRQKIRFQDRGDSAMCVHDGKGAKPLPAKEISREH